MQPRTLSPSLLSNPALLKLQQQLSQLKPNSRSNKFNQKLSRLLKHLSNSPSQLPKPHHQVSYLKALHLMMSKTQTISAIWSAVAILRKRSLSSKLTCRHASKQVKETK